MEKFDEQRSDSNSDSFDFRLVDDLHSVIQQANNCLLLRHFDDCLNICQKYITIAKNYTENER